MTSVRTTSLLALSLLLAPSLSGAVHADATQWSLRVVATPASVQFSERDCTWSIRTRSVILRNDGEAGIRLSPVDESGFTFAFPSTIGARASSQATVSVVQDGPASGVVRVAATFDDGAVRDGVEEVSRTKAAARARLARSLSLLIGEGPDYAPLQALVALAEQHFAKRSAELGRAVRASRDEVAALIAEKEQVLKEMAQGLYCSKCGNSKTQLERTGKTTFEEHLDEVDGLPVPAPPELMEQKTREYDGKIGAAAGKERSAIASIANEGAQREQRLAEIAARRADLERRHTEAIAALRQRITDQEAIDRAQVEALETRLRSARNEVAIPISDPCRREKPASAQPILPAQAAPPRGAPQRPSESDLLQRLAPLRPIIMQLARELRIPPALVAALAASEISRGTALSPNGARILRAGASRLKQLYDRVSGAQPGWTEAERWRAVATSYASGPTASLWSLTQWLVMRGEFGFYEDGSMKGKTPP